MSKTNLDEGKRTEVITMKVTPELARESKERFKDSRSTVLRDLLIKRIAQDRQAEDRVIQKLKQEATNQ